VREAEDPGAVNSPEPSAEHRKHKSGTLSITIPSGPGFLSDNKPYDNFPPPRRDRAQRGRRNQLLWIHGLDQLRQDRRNIVEAATLILAFSRRSAARTVGTEPPNVATASSVVKWLRPVTANSRMYWAALDSGGHPTPAQSNTFRRFSQATHLQILGWGSWPEWVDARS